MRILMLTDSFHPYVGGSETAIHRLSDTFVDMGHTVGVAVISRPDAFAPSSKFSFWNVSSRVFGIDMKFLGRIRNLRRVIREFRPDVLNVHFMLESGYVGVKAAKAEGVPVVITNRGKGLYNEPTNLAERLLYPFWNRGALGADAFIATSQEMVDRAKERYGIESLAISNGVDTDTFSPEKDGQAIRQRYGVQPGQRVLFCARRLVPKNGIEYIVRALPIVREKFDAVLWLASPLIREYEKLKKLSQELGIAEQVRFLDAVDHTELSAHFNAADVVVQPSIAEARSLACLEAMASGAVVLATATGGLAELITHGENGFLIAPFQESTYAVTEVFDDGVKRLGEAVITLLEDDALRQKIRLGARKYALTCSWPEIARQTLVVYERAIHSS
jgi:glycosyltransferase involved in cell wall biosynthesis